MDYQKKTIALYTVLAVISATLYSFSPFVITAFGVLYAIRYIMSTLLLDITRKCVVVTGCDTGFGNLLAKKLDSLGVRVFASCLTPSGVAALKESLSSQSMALALDITDEKSMEQFCDTVLTACGEDGLWALVNNAGIYEGSAMELTSVAMYRKVMDVNFFGYVSLTRRLIRGIKKAKGRIVNMSSLAGRCAMPGMSAYNASKYAVQGFSDALRGEMAPWGVSVSIIEPGSMVTPLLMASGTHHQRCFQQADQQAQQDYGDDWPLNVAKLHEQGVGIAGPPEVVVDAYLHAVQSKFPWHRYPLGLDSIFMLWISRLAPTYLTDIVVSFVFPTPRALQKK